MVGNDLVGNCARVGNVNIPYKIAYLKNLVLSMELSFYKTSENQKHSFINLVFTGLPNALKNFFEVFKISSRFLKVHIYESIFSLKLSVR